MKKFIKFLEDTIESNSIFMDVCNAEQAENPGTKFPYKKYFTSLGEINLAKKILRIILEYQKMENTPKTYKDVILDYFGWSHIHQINCIKVLDHSGDKIKIFRYGEDIAAFLNSLDFIEPNLEYPRFEITLWTCGYWGEVTPYKLYSTEYAPKMPE